MSMTSSSVPARQWGVAGLVGVCCSAFYAVLWALAGGGPFSVNNDALQYAHMLGVSNWAGSVGVSSNLNWPFGTDWVDLPVAGDRVMFVVVKAFELVSGDVWSAFTLWAFVAVALTGSATWLLGRWVGLSAGWAAVAALLFALSPGLLSELGQGHPFLAAMWVFPVTIWLALSGWEPQVAPSRWLTVAAAVAVGVSGTYYALYAALLLGVVAVVVWARSRQWRRAVPVAVSSVGVAVVAVVLLVPNLVARAGLPANNAMVRPVSDSDFYGLRLSQLVTPRPNHPVGVLASWGERGWSFNGLGSASANIGVFAFVGLVLVLVGALSSRVSPARHVNRLLGMVAGVVAVIAVSGGFGFVLATLGFTQLRAWNRFAPYLALIGVLGACGWLSSRFRLSREPRPLLAVLVLVLVVFADQGVSVPGGQVPDELAELAAVNEALDARWPEGATVFALPYVSFPDHLNSAGLGGPALSGTHSWSSVPVAGRAGDWQRSWSAQDPEVLVAGVAAAGFDVVAVDVDAGAAGDTLRLERGLREVLGAPLETVGSWRIWDLGRVAGRLDEEFSAGELERVGAAVVRPVAATVDGEGAASTGDEASWFTAADTSISVHDYSVGEKGPVRLVFSLQAAGADRVWVSDRRSGEGWSARLVDGVGVADVMLDDPDTTLDVMVRADDGSVPPSVWWELPVRISELRLVDPLLDRAAVAALGRAGSG